MEYLKDLKMFSFGMNDLPKNFVKLGKKMVSLDLSSNNFQKLSVITDVVNEENFPHLRSLSLTGCRATETLKDLTQIVRMLGCMLIFHKDSRKEQHS